MKKLWFKRFLIFLFLTLCICGMLYSRNNSIEEKETVKVIYFYLEACEACNEAGTKISHFYSLLDKEGMGSSVNILDYNVLKEYNLEYLRTYFKIYNVPESDQNLPILFIGENYYSGGENIEQGLDWLVKSLKNGRIPKLKIVGLKSES